MRLLALSNSEIERRLPLWCAMSDMFLDTELDHRDYVRIAGTIGAACYTANEARAIYHEDVVPAFAGNLLDVAGVWEGWTEEYVRERVLKMRGSSVYRTALVAALASHIHEEWARVVQLL